MIRWSLTVMVILATSATCFGEGPASDIVVPAGFEVSLFADDDLAHDIFSLTINAQGQVVVSGPGYVRTLIDSDQDGRADTYRTYADGPSTGAQGLCFDGHDLLCTGDAGLLRYRDRNGDGQADGPPEQLMNLKTGGEHFAHAVQKGPDGWWYVMLGNLAGISDKDVSLPSSPVLKPSAGVLMRMAPDFSGTEIEADGFRNPYDFAFHACGDAFAFDSDGERDVSLPWYRPTRVFQILPGRHAGWVSASWKRPDYYPDMLPVSADCGRGSPTGVVAYRHDRFPARYHDALFLLDWTFGRVFALSLSPDGSSRRGQAELFLTARGEFGFAPTDIAVTPEGDLMISVGGRGTRGGVYRVRYVRNDHDEQPTDQADDLDPLTTCLQSPQPLASWSRAHWIPLVRRLGKESLVVAALDAQRPVAQRIRAIEILTELFAGVDAACATALVDDPAPGVRARAAWSMGRRPIQQDGLPIVARLLQDADPVVVRCALDALLRNTTAVSIAEVFPQLLRLLDSPDRYVFQAAWKVVSRLSPQQQDYFHKRVLQQSARAQVAYALSVTDRQPRLNNTALELAWKVVCTSPDPALRLDAIRAVQMALGDVGGRRGLFPVYDGYVNGLDTAKQQIIDLGELSEIFPSGEASIDLELARLIAILSPAHSTLAQKLVGQLSEQSHPVNDLHYLIVLSRLAAPLSPDLREHVATALVRLETKLQSAGLQQDLNWDLRVGEMYGCLVQQDAQLAEAVVSHPQFGLPGHVVLARELDQRLRSRAAERVTQYLEQHPDVPCSSDVVFLLGQSDNPHHRDLVRQQFDDFALQNAVIMTLADRPEEIDRARFVVGLASPDFAVLRACVTALETLSACEEAADQFALLDALRKLGADQRERVLRDRIARLLQRNLGRSFGYRFGLTTNAPQTWSINGWTAYLKQRFPQAAALLLTSSEQQLAQLQELLTAVDWNLGEPQRGHTLFQKQSCNGCHNARTAAGPDLAGIGKRFSRDDLFTALAFPNHDVSPRYNTTLIQTARGKIVSGLVVYESADGVTLGDSTNQTLRIESDQIDTRHEIATSLMPAGLLDGLAPKDLADLYAYLRGL